MQFTHCCVRLSIIICLDFCRFDAFMREMDTRFPTTDTVFEYCVDPNQHGWLSWENKLSPNFR